MRGPPMPGGRPHRTFDAGDGENGQHDEPPSNPSRSPTRHLLACTHRVIHLSRAGHEIQRDFTRIAECARMRATSRPMTVENHGLAARSLTNEFSDGFGPGR